VEQPENLESRVAALEAQVRELNERVRHTQQDAAAARVLAGGADRDVTEIRAEIRDFRRATTASFTAMREDLTDLRTEVGGRFDVLAAGHQQIVQLLNTLVERDGGQPGGR
jgi:predicted  nucleic acid-binding Zn-ribbon protein